MEQGSSSQATSVGAGLFDWGVTRFVTPQLLRIAYPLAVVLLAIYSVVVFIAMANTGDIGALVAIVGVPLFFFVALAYLRVTIEVVAVLFRIGDRVEDIAASRREVPASEDDIPQPTLEAPPRTQSPTVARSNSTQGDPPQPPSDSALLAYLLRAGPTSTGSLSDELPMSYGKVRSELETLSQNGLIHLGDDGLWHATQGQ